MANYNVFRLFISEQPNLFHTDNTKEDIDKKGIFRDILFKLQNEGKENYIYKYSNYTFYYNNYLGEDIHILQFAREEVTSNPQDVDGRLQYVRSVNYPFIYVIIDWNRQIVLVQNKPSVFPTLDNAIQRLENYFEKSINNLVSTHYKVILSSISKDVDFWREVETADRIYSLELNFNPPNLFEGRFDANDLVEGAYEATGFTKFKLKFINDKGRLHLLKENLRNYISLIASGGGNYVLKLVKSAGKKKVSRHINSNTYASQQTLPDNIEEVTPEDLVKSLKQIDTQNETESEESKEDKSKSLPEAQSGPLDSLFTPRQEIKIKENREDDEGKNKDNKE